MAEHGPVSTSDGRPVPLAYAGPRDPTPRTSRLAVAASGTGLLACPCVFGLVLFLAVACFPHIIDRVFIRIGPIRLWLGWTAAAIGLSTIAMARLNGSAGRGRGFAVAGFVLSAVWLLLGLALWIIPRVVSLLP